MARHDENKDVRLVSARCKVNAYDKSIEATKGTIIGNRLWGRIDYLCHYCGYRFYWVSNPVKASIVVDNPYAVSKRDAKRDAKAHTLTDKTRKRRKE